ncbi:hypothetical protein SCWH03_47310 [Streptomyces pacificus]|uniref:Ferric siderophore reductase C-terminal domain-containing protein n=1 Tax=Streptomyces pacificus TaxID=2705029 RepID=A0A6A0AZU9_9ACTN|nr:(2Fe-2S)-binding protein [Streptomyces pacificus]GFH38489.1 hypothetical protein SCWH03_47310 [Streptomyces pacificus]
MPGVSPHTLRGNASSALIGAHRVLLAKTTAPLLPLVRLVRGLLDRPPLAGTGTYRFTPPRPLAFRRRSCCLYYRVPGTGTCGDCVLNPKERRRPHDHHRADRRRNPGGGTQHVWPLPVDEATLLDLVTTVFTDHWQHIHFGPSSKAPTGRSAPRTRPPPSP